MDCGVCGDPTNQMDAERRDLGGDDPAFVCPGCQDLADDVAGDSGTSGQGVSGCSSTIGGSGTSGTIGGYSERGSSSGPASDSSSSSSSDSDSSNGVTTKYAI